MLGLPKCLQSLLRVENGYFPKIARPNFKRSHETLRIHVLKNIRNFKYNEIFRRKYIFHYH